MIVVLALVLAATAAPPSMPGGPSMLGGLPLKVAHGGAMDGMTDISPLTRAQVRLRQDPRITAIKIVPAGWQVTTAAGISPATLVTSVCAILVAEHIPASAEVAITVRPSVKAALVRRCNQPR